VHRNTIAYRLQPVAGLLAAIEATEGGWTEASARRLEIELALHLVGQLGPQAAA
jgi:hypothetical protein